MKQHGDWRAQQYIVSEFLPRRNLVAPNGRPLYGYRCQEEEWEKIGNLLHDHPPDNSRRQLYIPALFCLFAAEWWRRHYSGGPWKWEAILSATNAVGLNPRELAESGLRYWGRRILRDENSNKLYLVTLILEGGLPMGVLNTDRGWLSNYLKKVLWDIDRFGGDQDTATRLAANHGYQLPVTLRNPEICALVGRLLSGVLHHREKLPDHQVNDPIAWLDTHYESWRDDLPIVVADETARDLLAGLMRETVSLRRRRGTLTTLVRRTLLPAAGEWHPAVDIVGEGRLDTGALPASAWDTLTKARRARFYAAGALEALTPRPLAVVRHDKDDADRDGWTLEPLSRGPVRLFYAPTAAVEFSIRVDGRDINRFVPSGGEPLPPGPWIFFAPDDDGAPIPRELRFLGSGSARRQAPRLFVACPDETWQLVLGEPATDLGPIAGTGRRIKVVAGIARIVDPVGGPAIVLRTADAVDQGARLLVQAPSSPWPIDGLPALIGQPVFKEAGLNGAISTIDRKDLRWRPARLGAPWRPLTTVGLPHGAVDVAIVRKDEVVDQVTIAVLPAAMAVAGSSSGAFGGTLTLSGLAGGVVGLDKDSNTAGVQVTINRGADAVWTVTIVATGMPPASISLHLQFPDGGWVTCTLPVPTSGGGFLGPSGCWLPGSACVALDQLYGLRARAGASGGTLIAYNAKSQSGRRFWIRRRLDEKEFSLAALRTSFLRLLAAAPTVGPAIDMTIQVIISSGGRDQMLRLAWFDLEFIRDKIGVTIKDWKTLTPVERGAVEILCRPVDNVAGEEHSLSSETGTDASSPCWHLASANLAPGSWLVYGRIAGRYRLRPIIWEMPGSLASPVVANGLVASSRITDFAQRRAALAAALADMACQPDHPDWNVLDGALDVLQGTLPLTTLDSFSRLVEQPDALLTFLARAPADRIPAILNMDNELTFLWVLLPLDAWRKAFARTRAFQTDCTVSAELPSHVRDALAKQVNDTILQTLQRICDIKPYLSQTAMMVREHLGLSKKDDCTTTRLIKPEFKKTLSASLEGLRIEVWRRNVDQDWPDWCKFREKFKNLPRENTRGAPHTVPILDAPFVAADIAVRGESPDAETVQALRLCREFDSDWFNAAYPVALGLAVIQSRTSP